VEVVRRNLDCAPQALLHPGYAGWNEPHGYAGWILDADVIKRAPRAEPGQSHL